MRGLEFVREAQKRKGIVGVGGDAPAVIGAVIDLGDCLDLTTSNGIKMVQASYETLAAIARIGRKHDASGRSTTALKTKARQTIKGAWVAHRFDMLNSPAYWALSHVACRMLTLMEIEHCQQGGAENGKLIVTYDDWERRGIRRKSIAGGLAELVELGFVEVMKRGFASASDVRSPSKYRLTYLNTLSSGPTDEWQRLDEDDVAAIMQKRKAPRQDSSQDIDSRGINAPIPVGAKTPLETSRLRGAGAPGNGAKMPLVNVFKAAGVGR